MLLTFAALALTLESLVKSIPANANMQHHCRLRGAEASTMSTRPPSPNWKGDANRALSSSLSTNELSQDSLGGAT